MDSIWGLEDINVRSNVAVYVQIENHIQFAIASGRLAPGDRLPSVGHLSESLGVNPNTVAKAYRDLEVLGLIYTRRGLGVYINSDVRQKCQEECRRRMISHIYEVAGEARASGIKLGDLIHVARKAFAAESGPYANPPESLFDTVEVSG